MDKKQQVFIYIAAAYTLLSMMAMIIQSRKRKRREPVEPITYAPIEERDRMRIEYLNNKIWKNDVTCVNMLRLNRASFFRFCKLLGTGAFCKTPYICVLSSRLQCF
ncbi:hypothetical protein PAHAL_5G321500 [Panicum hallii]|uniref:Uncharacterized protein n=1 Tax=Panicum hallii TaxID=206008 RepID=A0A2T8ILY8_9POAL|nr:hypothetical protein PAHAL_5G321500 [Panicum hallii]